MINTGSNNKPKIGKIVVCADISKTGVLKITGCRRNVRVRINGRVCMTSPPTLSQAVFPSSLSSSSLSPVVVSQFRCSACTILTGTVITQAPSRARGRGSSSFVTDIYHGKCCQAARVMLVSQKARIHKMRVVIKVKAVLPTQSLSHISFRFIWNQEPRYFSGSNCAIFHNNSTKIPIIR